MKISLFASSVRCWLWNEFMRNLSTNAIEYEVVFAGDLNEYQTRPFLKKYPSLKYIHTGKIKPSQCYEAARRACTGELVFWVCDDAEFSPNLLDNVYKFWHNQNYLETIVSVKTNEDSKNNNLDDHRFFGGNVNTPLMAPLGVMNRMYLDNLGGIDQRYISGQYENDIVMRVLENGGKVVKYEEGCVYIEHIIKHGKGTKFWTSYEEDRKVLENSWVKGGYEPPPKSFAIYMPFRQESEPMVARYYPVTNREVLKKRQDTFVPFSDEDLLTKNQGQAGIWA